MRLILIFLIAAFCYGQGTVTVGGGSGTIRNGATDPASCTAGKELFINTASTPVLKLCTAPNTWSDVGILGAGTGDVLGAASLVSPGLVPYIASLGTLGSDSGLAFNTTTKSLGVFGPITSGQTSTYLGKLVLNGITSGTITVQPANAAGTWSMTLPTSGGANGYVLTTNGSGVTSWAAAPGDVLGGASLTTTNRVPYVSSSGTLGSDSGLSYNSSTDSLGVIGDVTIGQTSTGSGKVKFNGLTSGTVTVQPADAAGTWTMTLPTSGGTNGYVLTTDGNGVTSWAAGGGGSGGASAGASFTTQTSVTITHNWNTLYYTTGCADSSGVTVTPATTTIGLNTAVFTFDPALTGTCAATTGGGTGGGSMTYPGAGVANSTGSAWDTSYAVGTSANNLLQLNSSAQIPAVSGTLVTALNASALASGTVPTARLGSGTADGTTYLRGDGTWATGTGGSGGGAVYPIVFAGDTTLTVTAATHGLGTTPVPAGGCRRTSDGVWPDGWAMTTNSSGDITIVPAAGAAFTGTCYVAGTAGGNLVLTDPLLVPTRLSTTASLTYATFSGDGNCQENSVTLAGAATGDVPTVGLPTGFPMGIIVGGAYVSATNTVVVKLCRLGGSATISGSTFTVQIVRAM